MEQQSGGRAASRTAALKLIWAGWLANGGAAVWNFANFPRLTPGSGYVTREIVTFDDPEASEILVTHFFREGDRRQVSNFGCPIGDWAGPGSTISWLSSLCPFPSYGRSFAKSREKSQQSARSIPAVVLQGLPCFVCEQCALLICESLMDRFTPPLIWLLGKTQAGKTSIVAEITGEAVDQVGCGFVPVTKHSRI